jgi:hypothetical protein
VDQALLARRNWLLALLFALCTASAVFVGVKVVSFEAFGQGRTLAERGTLLTVLAALCIAENSALARAVDATTRRPGALRRELHPHALFYASDKSIGAKRPLDERRLGSLAPPCARVLTAARSGAPVRLLPQARHRRLPLPSL